MESDFLICQLQRNFEISECETQPRVNPPKHRLVACSGLFCWGLNKQSSSILRNAFLRAITLIFLSAKVSCFITPRAQQTHYFHFYLPAFIIFTSLPCSPRIPAWRFRPFLLATHLAGGGGDGTPYSPPPVILTYSLKTERMVERATKRNGCYKPHFTYAAHAGCWDRRNGWLRRPQREWAHLLTPR